MLRLLYGGRVSLGVGLAAALCAASIGTALGLLAGYYGGRLDAFLMRLADSDRVWELFSPDMLVAIQLSWVVVFFATLGYRKLTTGEELTPGEIDLGVATLFVGFGGGRCSPLRPWHHFQRKCVSSAAASRSTRRSVAARGFASSCPSKRGKCSVDEPRSSDAPGRR